MNKLTRYSILFLVLVTVAVIVRDCSRSQNRVTIPPLIETTIVPTGTAEPTVTVTEVIGTTAPTLTPQPTDTPEPAAPTAHVTIAPTTESIKSAAVKNPLTIRSGPGPDASIVGYYSAGDVVVIDKCEHIGYFEAGGAAGSEYGWGQTGKGWINTRYVSPDICGVRAAD